MSEKKKNVLLWKFGNKCTRNVYKYLGDDINIKVIIDRKKDWPDKRECSATMYDMNDFYRSLPLSRNRMKADYHHHKEYVDIYRKLQKDANTFLYVYSRRPVINGENNFQDMMDAFHIYIHLFIDMLKTHEIDYVIFVFIPHHADFILYRVAEELGIKTLMFNHYSLLLGKSFMFSDLNQIGVSGTGGQDVPPVKVERNQRHSYQDDPFMKKLAKKLTRQPDSYLKLISALLFRRDIDLFFYRLMNIRKNRQFKKNYRDTVSSDMPSGKFVYFPLHYQPELTTAPLGGIFADQIIAIEYLRALLPDDWSIAVKENPTQNFHSRGTLFFERLRRIPKTIYLDKKISTFALIEKCEFVATVTGTAGMEALSFGKCVLVFGNATYKHFPGVIEYRDNLRLEDIMAVRFTHEELEAAHAKLQRNMVDLVVNWELLESPRSFDNDGNARKLAEVINQFIRKEERAVGSLI